MIRSLGWIVAGLVLAWRAEAQPPPAPLGAPFGGAAPGVTPDTLAVCPPCTCRACGGEDEDFAHLRFGVGIDATYLWSNGQRGIESAGIGLQARVGAQIDQWLAVYYQAHGILAATLGSNGNLLGAGVLGAVFNSVVVEATLPVLHVGVGPSVDLVGMASLLDESKTVGPGVECRAALAIGGHGPGRHGAFILGFDFHPTLVSGTWILSASAGIGGEMY